MAFATTHNFPADFKPYGETMHRPYQCFMGRWEGLCKTFTTQGVFLESSAVHMDVYWKDAITWHLHEHFENFDKELFEVPKHAGGYFSGTF